MKQKNRLMRLIPTFIYIFLLTIPLFSIVGRVLYTQWNHNAYQSYSLNKQTEREYVTDINYNEYYYFDSSKVISYTQSFGFYADDISDIYTSYNNSYLNNMNQYYQWYFEIGTSNTINAFSKDDINSSLAWRFTFTAGSNSQYLMFRFRLISRSYISSTTFDFLEYCPLYQLSIVGTLDSAFDYSLHNIIDTYGKGVIDFTSWLVPMFFTNVNTLYIQFLNFVCNWILLSTAVYFALSVVLWFMALLDWIVHLYERDMR